jgi:uncharacterized protein with NRDE domain
MSRGIEQFSHSLKGDQPFNEQHLLSILSDKTLANVNKLPNTGLSIEEERLLSSIFIPEISLRGMPYGTRSSSVIWLNDVKGKAEMLMKTKDIIKQY